MSGQFIGEVRIFACNFAPRGWSFCNGQLIAIASNTALFSLLGTTYGGNGTSNFALPDFRGRLAMGFGNGAGLTPRSLGEVTGVQTVTLLPTQMTQHNHSFNVSSAVGTQATSSNAQPANGTKGGFLNPQSVLTYSSAAPNQAMIPTALSAVGSNLPHNNLMPFLTLNYCIATQGIFPARN